MMACEKHEQRKTVKGSALKFEWDEDKRQSNVAKHGIDFEEAAEIFDGRMTVTMDSTFPSEARLLTIGRRLGDTITVVWTWRGETIRIISARRSRRNEYHDAGAEALSWWADVAIFDISTAFV